MKRFPVRALRNVDIVTPDMGISERFYVDVWSLDLVARSGGVTYFAATGEDHHVLALHPGAAPGLLSTTFRVAAAADLAALAASAARAGATILSPPVANDGPDGGTIMTLREPQGAVLRFVHGDRRRSNPKDVAGRPCRLAHVNVNSRDVDALTRFYEDGLGFTMTDRSKAMSFVRTNADHHAMVLAEAKVDGLNHVAFQMPDLESVMRAAGRMIDNGFPIGWGSAATARATTSSPISSTPRASSSNTPPKCCRSTTITSCAAPTTGSGRPAAPIIGASPHRSPTTSKWRSSPCRSSADAHDDARF